MGSGDGKSPYLMREGHLGIGPAGAMSGDAVAIFCGARIPFILRPDGEHGYFVFVGEAYCDGVMDGEVVAREEKRVLFLK